MKKISTVYSHTLSVLESLFPQVKVKYAKDIYPYRIYIRKPVLQSDIVIYTIMYASFLGGNIALPFTSLDDDTHITTPISSFASVLDCIKKEFTCIQSENICDIIYNAIGVDGYQLKIYIDKNLLSTT